MEEIIKDLANADYHARPEIGKSGLDAVHKSMAHYYAPRKKATTAMETGIAFHTLVLETEKFEQQYVRSIECDRRTKDGKEKWAEFLEQNPDKTILKIDAWESLMRMKESMDAHPRISNYFESGQAETSIFWEMNATGCKARPDWMVNDGEFIIDLKTTADASPEAFAKSCANYRYHVQDAWYSKAVESVLGIKPVFVFVVVESTEPHSVAIYTLSLESKDEGWMVADKDFRKYVDYMAKSEEERFSGYSPDALEITLPRWAFEELMFY